MHIADHAYNGQPKADRFPAHRHSAGILPATGPSTPSTQRHDRRAGLALGESELRGSESGAFLPEDQAGAVRLAGAWWKLLPAQGSLVEQPGERLQADSSRQGDGGRDVLDRIRSTRFLLIDFIS